MFIWGALSLTAAPPFLLKSTELNIKGLQATGMTSTNTGRASGPQCPILHSPSPIHAEREARRTNATDSDVDPDFRFRHNFEIDLPGGMPSK